YAIGDVKSQALRALLAPFQSRQGVYTLKKSDPEERASRIAAGSRRVYETSPPQIPATGGMRCRAPGREARGLGASLSGAAGACRRAGRGRRRERRFRAPDCTMAVGAPRS